MRSVVPALVAILAAATAARAQAPSLVGNFRVVPVYFTPPVMKVSWFEPVFPQADYYDVFRSVDGGAETLLENLRAVAPDNPMVVVDDQVVATSNYTYRVDACNRFGCRTTVPFTTSPRVVWPIDGDHEVLHGFNEPIGWAALDADMPLSGCPLQCAGGANDRAACATAADCPGGTCQKPGACIGPPTGFHDGLDLNKTTPSGQPGDGVLAPRGGVVTAVTTTGVDLDNGNIVILVLVGSGVREFDSFNHIATTPGDTPADFGVAVGDAVAPGQMIARIGTQHFPNNLVHHVHHLLTNSTVTHRNARNNLLMFTDPDDRDPKGDAPELFDENGDGKVVLYRDHQTGNLISYDPATRPLSGDVDIEPEVTDHQGDNPRQAPIDLGYWIAGPLPASEQLDDVKRSTSLYELYDFRTVYFGLQTGPPVDCSLVSDTDDVANAGCRGQKAAGCPNRTAGPCNSTIKDGASDFPYPVMHHFIVTHASDDSGAPGMISANQYWRTNAKDDKAPVEGPHANYANQPTTTKASDARFPDGDYIVHVIASDLVHDKVDLTLPDPTRLENFAPIVVEMLVGADLDGNPSSTLPGLAGCELQLYRYKHRHGDPYPEPTKLALARAASTARFIRPNTKLCVRVRFSEPMSSADVALVGKRGTGAPIVDLVGSLQQTFEPNDTWAGTVTLLPDPSGNSDSSVGGDDDVAVQVKAFDRADATGTRGLDADGDGVPDPSGDNNALVKLDLSFPVKSLDVIK